MAAARVDGRSGRPSGCACRLCLCSSSSGDGGGRGHRKQAAPAAAIAVAAAAAKGKLSLILLTVMAIIIGGSIDDRFAHGAQVMKSPIDSVAAVAAAGEKTADLTRLINETLIINNKSLPSLGSLNDQSNSNNNHRHQLKDDWTFDMVEYDLMEFLQDLGARYQGLKGDAAAAAAAAAESKSAEIEARDSPTAAATTKEPASSSSPASSLATATATVASTAAAAATTTTTTAAAATTTTKTVNEEGAVSKRNASSMPTTTEISTSLADDHEIAESSWQYGIFDRFTRPRTSTTTTSTASPPISPVIGNRDPIVYGLATGGDTGANSKVMRLYNSEECGLRTYFEESRPNEEQLFSPPMLDDPSMGEASKELFQRRQRPTLSPSAHRKYQIESAAELIVDELKKDDQATASREAAAAAAASQQQQQEAAVLANWANKLERDAYDSYRQPEQQQQHHNQQHHHNQQQQQQPPASSLLDDSGSSFGGGSSSSFGAGGAFGGAGSGASSGGGGSGSESSSSGEFNLASRRHWLQQQLGNTLQLLGFNGSAQSVSEFLNQSSGLSLNSRENMMKKSSKLGKSVLATAEASAAAEITDQQQLRRALDSLAARQDELKLEPRVIGGSDARLGDSPWSVSLQALVSRPGTGGVEYRHYCGGTIISEYYVLTAAHCLDFMVGRESRLFVVIGDLNWRMSTASLHGRRFGIDKLIIHSGYKSTAFGHDIGLIRTKESMRPVKVNGRYIINSVCLPERNAEHSGEAELVGWGLFSNRNEMADSLQIADVPILPRPLCVDLYRRRTGLIQWLIGIELITDKQVCAGTFGRGICQGDSGSALVFNQKVSLKKRRARALAAARLEPGLLDPVEPVQPVGVGSGGGAGASLAANAVGAASVAAPAGKQAPPLAAQNDNQDIVGKGILRGYEHREQLQSRATIIGIVAFGGIRRCSYQSLPGVYMQTSKYMDWILPRIQS